MQERIQWQIHSQWIQARIQWQIDSQMAREIQGQIRWHMKSHIQWQIYQQMDAVTDQVTYSVADPLVEAE